MVRVDAALIYIYICHLQQIEMNKIRFYKNFNSFGTKFLGYKIKLMDVLNFWPFSASIVVLNYKKVLIKKC